MTKMLALVVACAATASAHADMIAYWNFNTLTTATNNGTTYAADQGLGQLLLNVPSTDQAGSNRGINSFGGTTVNGLTGEVNGQALSVQGSSLDSGSTTAVLNNGSTLTFSFSMTSFEDLILSFASQRTSTGFNSNIVSWSIDGANFTDLGPAYTPNTTFATTGVLTFDFSSIAALDNAATAYVRITLNGATNIGGNNRFDNIQLNATLVPTPGAAALMGLGLLAFRRRTR
ncbi:MAG TPA: hypothetical protein VD997_06455 [Phycisphaerales bacterium]|nr:hypothetical protein [Phycisphaerales bacterium]